MKIISIWGLLILFYQFSYAQIHAPVTLKSVSINYAVDSQFFKEDLIELKALDDDVVLEFKDIGTTPLHHDTFQFILDGYDKQWTKTTFPIARYTQLKGGDYTLKAKWNNDEATMWSKKIHVERALSEEPWFYPSVVSCILLVVGAVFYFWNIYNLRQKLKVESIRNHIASDLHDEVGATLSSVAISVRTVQRKLSKDAPDLANILDKVRAISEETNLNLRDTVWTINPENDSFEKMMDRMSGFAFQILPAQDIELTFDNSVDTTKPFKISMEQRRNVYLMFKEAVNNIARHSEATKALIKLSREKEGILLHIEDNGKGFSISDNYDGNGLKNFRRRAAESFIELDVKSTPSRNNRDESVFDPKIPSGTIITMLIPEL
jgi:signal transduction histidine kinase